MMVNNQMLGLINDRLIEICEFLEKEGGVLDGFYAEG